MTKPSEPPATLYQGYRITMVRAQSIGVAGCYYTAVASRAGRQKLNAHGTQDHCTAAIHDLIDEEVRIRFLASPDLIPLGTMAARPARSRPKI
jgi:hypothetical protein